MYHRLQIVIELFGILVVKIVIHTKILKLSLLNRNQNQLEMAILMAIIDINGNNNCQIWNYSYKKRDDLHTPKGRNWGNCQWFIGNGKINCQIWSYSYKKPTVFVIKTKKPVDRILQMLLFCYQNTTIKNCMY